MNKISKKTAEIIYFQNKYFLIGYINTFNILLDMRSEVKCYSVTNIINF